MAVTITPEELYYGSPATLTYGGVDVGGTTEPPTIHIDITEFHPDFQNAAGPVVGTSIITDIMVRAELMVNQMTAAKLAWALPGSASTATSTAVVAGGGATTLSAAAAAGATTISVTAVTGLIVGDFVRVGAVGPTADYAQITAIASLDLTLDRALANAHASGASVTEVEGDGRTTITWSAGRVPSTAYQDLVLVGQGLDGRTMTVTIQNAFSSENISLEFGKGSVSGLSMNFIGHYDPTSPYEAPFTVAFSTAS